MDRGGPPQELLDGRRDAIGVGCESGALGWMLGEERNHAVESGSDRVETTEEEQVANAEQLDLAERLAVDGGLHDVGEKSAVGILPTLGNCLPEILVDGGSCLFPDSLRSLEVPRWHVRADGVVAPLEELRQILCRETHQREEDPRGKGRRELLVKVAALTFGDGVEQLEYEPADVRLQLLDLSRHEAWVEEPTVRGVTGWIHLERDEWLLPDAHGSAGRTEDFGMAKGPLHIRISGDHDTRMIAVMASSDRAGLQKLVIRGVGVLGRLE